MAVYTELSLLEIKSFLDAYDLPALKAAEGIRAGVENTNYRLEFTDGSRYILTLFERRMRAEDLPFFADLMRFLSRQSVSCPLPVAASDGTFIHTFKNKPALMVTFLEGRAADAIEPAHLSALGAATAKMHQAIQTYERRHENALAFKGWGERLDAIRDRADTIAPGLAALLAKELHWLSEHWPKHLPAGIIHGDLFPDNVFFDEHKNLSGIIDFYLAGYDFFAYELAICINAWCFDASGALDKNKSAALFTAYQKVNSLTDAECKAMPALARGAAFNFLLLRAHHWLFRVEGALVTPKDPLEYVQKLKFHQSVAHHGEYGL